MINSYNLIICSISFHNISKGLLSLVGPFDLHGESNKGSYAARIVFTYRLRRFQTTSACVANPLLPNQHDSLVDNQR